MASGYVTLLSLDEQLRVTQSTLKSREEAFNLAKRQFETGYSSRLELMQSDSELRATRAQYLITSPVTHNANVFAPAQLTLVTRKKKPGDDWAPPIGLIQRADSA